MEITYSEFPVLVVDDEPDILRSFRFGYGDEFSLLTAAGGAEGLELLRTHEPAVIVADQRMPGMTGTEFLVRSMEVRPEALRIILTGYTDIEAIIAAVNQTRIYRYVTKPWESEDLRMALRRAIEAYRLGRENQRLVEELRRANDRLAMDNAYLRTHGGEGAQELVGTSPALREISGLVAKVAGSRSTVLLEGETGTGKELVARAIHAASPRSDRLFVAINCAAVAEGTLESEMFGHRRGAFTGAVADRKGLFEVADGGTLFLDEVGDMPLALQAKLLRALEEGEIRAIGDNEPRRVDVRVIAATNRRLEDEVKAGRFREDLYYRLRVFPIRLPPLRERREDIPLLARHLTRRIASELGKTVGEPTEDTIVLLQSYPFAGNIRELANELERAIILAEPGAPVTEDLLSDHIVAGAARAGGPGLEHQVRTDDFERAEIAAALERTNGVRARAATELGITYRGLLKRMRRLGL